MAIYGKIRACPGEQWMYLSHVPHPNREAVLWLPNADVCVSSTADKIAPKSPSPKSLFI